MTVIKSFQFQNIISISLLCILKEEKNHCSKILCAFVEPVLQLVRESSTSALSALKYPEERRPSSPKRAESPTNTDPPIDRIFMKKRPRSPKRHKKISVNQRPFSASNVNQSPSHYVQLLKSPYMQKTVPSPKVLNKLLRPQSGGARLGWWCGPRSWEALSSSSRKWKIWCQDIFCQILLMSCDGSLHYTMKCIYQNFSVVQSRYSFIFRWSRLEYNLLFTFLNYHM